MKKSIHKKRLNLLPQSFLDFIKNCSRKNVFHMRGLDGSYKFLVQKPIMSIKLYKDDVLKSTIFYQCKLYSLMNFIRMIELKSFW